MKRIPLKFLFELTIFSIASGRRLIDRIGLVGWQVIKYLNSVFCSTKKLQKSIIASLLVSSSEMGWSFIC